MFYNGRVSECVGHYIAKNRFSSSFFFFFKNKTFIHKFYNLVRIHLESERGEIRTRNISKGVITISQMRERGHNMDRDAQ